ncbi:MAG: 4'-phosphopantetheinyl transferase superfamily protein [Pseudomonadota bacterium]
MSVANIDIWFAEVPSSDPRELMERCESIISANERESVNRFRFEERRREALLTRALARTALSKFIGCALHECRFDVSSEGRPFLENAPEGFDFNISHSAGCVVIAASKHAQVGIDTESYARADEISEIASRVLTRKETAAADALKNEARIRRLVELWALKEAWSKASGDGVGADFLSIEFEIASAKKEAVISNAGNGWRFALIDIFQAHATAVAVQTVANILSINTFDGLELMTA